MIRFVILIACIIISGEALAQRCGVAGCRMPQCWGGYQSNWQTIIPQPTYRTIVPQPNAIYGVPVVATREERIEIASQPFKTTRTIKADATPKAAVQTLVACASPRRGETLVDAGCGDGRILISAAHVFGLKVVGIEREPDRCKLARENLANAKVPNFTVICNDASDYDYSQADIVTLYVVPELMEAIVPKLKPGARAVSYTHPFTTVSCRHLVRTIDGKQHNFYLYEVPDPSSWKL